MLVKALYAVVVILVAVTGWQIVSLDRAYGALQTYEDAQGTGAPAGQAKVTIYAFIDYSSSFSRDVYPLLMQAVQEAPDVRVVFFPVPQAAKPSMKAARLALAAAKQGKFLPMHETLIWNDRPMTDEVAHELAVKAGFDAGALDKDADSAAIAQNLATIVRAAARLGVPVTPAFLVNRRTLFYTPEKLPGYPDFVQLIKEART